MFYIAHISLFSPAGVNAFLHNAITFMLTQINMVLSMARLRRNADVSSRKIISSRNKLVIMIGFISSDFGCMKDVYQLQVCP